MSEYICLDIKNENQPLDEIEYVQDSLYFNGNILEKENLTNKYIEKIEKELESEEIPENIDKKLKTISFLKIQKEKLEKVKPQALTYSDISVPFGATWIPTEIYYDFLKEHLETYSYGYDSWRIEYNSHINEFVYEGRVAYPSYYIDDKYGIDHRTYKNADKVMLDTLNQKAIKITHNGKLDKEKTKKIASIQKMIKEEFNDWVFKDEKRRNEIVKIYNEKFNNINFTDFNGDFLKLKGISNNISLKKHQKDAVARILLNGNTLLAHSVGAGKTFVMIASAMESKRLGLSNKSMFVVPKSIIGQFEKDFYKLYPNANLLVASKDDFSSKNRKKFCSKISTGNYDAIIIGHTQFEKIPLSKERQAYLFQEEINKLDEFIRDNPKISSYTVKKMAAKRIKIENDIKKSMENKDDVVTFEELGIDRLYVDEAHYFKNIAPNSKLENVSGITSSTSQRARDMKYKVDYINELTDYKGVVFATGTPISNSMVELYTMQMYLQPQLMEELNLTNFDSWLSWCCTPEISLEISVTSDKYEQKVRLKNFFNLPELMSSFKLVADIKTHEVLNLDIPETKYINIKEKASDFQKFYIDTLIERANKIKTGKVDPTEDNMLKITNEGKRIALDPRLVYLDAEDLPNSKVNQCINLVADIWERTKIDKKTQLIFCDQGTPNSNGKFNLYGDIKEKLVNIHGIPENEIAFIHDADTDSKKEILFDKVRSGEVRILLGSTDKCGAGVNIQDKLTALHHLDIPWRPADIEQREGRIARQGNENDDVEVYRYITQGSFDAYLWQLLETKAKFIKQVFTNKSPVRKIEGTDDIVLSYTEMKAAALDNPLLKRRVEVGIKIDELEADKKRFTDRLYLAQDKLKEIPKEMEITKEFIDNISKDLEYLETEKEKNKDKKENEFPGIVIDSKEYKDKAEASQVLIERVKSSTTFLKNSREQIAFYKGFYVYVSFDNYAKVFNFELEKNGSYFGQFGIETASNNFTRMDNCIKKIPEILETHKENLKQAEFNLEKYNLIVKEIEFPKNNELISLKNELIEIDNKIEEQIKLKNNDNYVASDLGR